MKEEEVNYCDGGNNKWKKEVEGEEAGEGCIVY